MPVCVVSRQPWLSRSLYPRVATQVQADVMSFLLENLPPQMHLAIATLEDPLLPLTRLRACGQMIELHAGDLRYTFSESVEFLNQAMGLSYRYPDHRYSNYFA